MHLLQSTAILAVCLTAISPRVYAQSSVGINFVGGSLAGGVPMLMQPAEIAGAESQDHWNNAGVFGSPHGVDNEAGTLAVGSLVDASGITLTGTTVTWDASNTFSNMLVDSPGGNRLMKGYLDTADPLNTFASTAAVVTVANLPNSYATTGYDVLVYYEGFFTIAPSQDRVGRYRLFAEADNTGMAIAEIFGRDASTTFDGTYIEAAGTSTANSTAGNYVRFRGLTEATFTIDATGFALPGSAVPRAPINGIQIVPAAAIPEPNSLALLACAIVGLFVVRSRIV